MTDRALPILGFMLIAGGLFLFGYLVWSIWRPVPPPYSYNLVAEGRTEKFPELGLKDHNDFPIKKYEIRVPGIEKPIAAFHVADSKSKEPVLLEWRNYITEPVITLTSTISETQALARAVKKHANNNALILAWWDTSRRLALLNGSTVLFKETVAGPVLVPSIWSGHRATIESLEREFWKVLPDSSTNTQFEAYVDALLSDEVVGVAKLRQLTEDREAYIVVHITDAYKIGAISPDRFSVGFKDFGKSGNLHGTVKRIKGWIKEQGHKAYTVHELEGGMSRVFFLSDKLSTETLLARMLPFDTSNPFKLSGLRPVYQHGGYWVFKLPPPQTVEKR